MDLRWCLGGRNIRISGVVNLHHDFHFMLWGTRTKAVAFFSYCTQGQSEQNPPRIFCCGSGERSDTQAVRDCFQAIHALSGPARVWPLDVVKDARQPTPILQH